MALFLRQNDPSSAKQADANLGPAILISCAVTAILAAMTVMVRMYVRTRIIRSVGLEDHTILLALALSLSGLGLIIAEVRIGAGRHASSLSPDVISIGLLYTFVIQLVYLWATTIVKTSIALFLIRFATANTFRQFLQTLIVFFLLYATIGFIVQLIQCAPQNHTWGFEAGGYCLDSTSARIFNYVTCSISLVTDIIFAILPAQMLYNVQVKTRVKLAICSIMSLIVLAAVASMVKIHYISICGLTEDLLYDYSNLTIWTVVECNVSIIAASLPCLRPLVKKCLGSSGTTTSNFVRETPEILPEGRNLWSLLPYSRRKSSLIDRFGVSSSPMAPDDGVRWMYACASQSIAAQLDREPGVSVKCLTSPEPENEFTAVPVVLP